jgi:transposase
VAAHQKKVRDLHGCLAFTDESGFLVAPLLRSTLAPRGQTPMLRQFGRYRHRVSVAAALVLHPSGHLSLYYQSYPELNVTGERYARFIHDLLWQVRGPLVLLHDGLNTHQGPDMARLQQRFPRLHPRLLPPYAPELNPVEYLWADAKSQTLANYTPYSVPELDRTILHTLEGFRHDQHRLRSFLARTPLAWNPLTVFS